MNWEDNLSAEIRKPPRLEAGQTIGLVAPASATGEPDQIRYAIEVIESLGFRVKPGAHLFDRFGYLAGQDRDRAADLNGMFADDTVAAIFALRGGYGSMRILPYLDYELIRANPKIFLGYSDITALHQAFQVKTGLVTFHGPIALAGFSPYSLAEFEKVLLRPQAGLSLAAPPPVEPIPGRPERTNRLIRFVPGRARGRLMGGNLTLLSHLLGTPYQPDFQDKILLLEDVGESVYRIDRMLTQLWLAGCLNRLAGIVFGKFTNCRPAGSWTSRFSLEEVLAERSREIGRPALGGLMIGHVDDQATLPFGCLVDLDVEAGTLTLCEEAVL